MKHDKQRWITMVFAASLLCTPVLWQKPAAAAGETPLVSLTVEERVGVSRRSEPVTAGVPLPKGVVHDAGSLALLDERGRRVAGDIRAVNRWLDDGSVKWVHLHFQSDVPGNS